MIETIQNTLQNTLQNTWLKDLIGLVYPDICCSCDRRLAQSEDLICLQCLFDLPKTDYPRDTENPIAKRLAGRIPFEQATAMFTFSKKGKIQNMMYHLKYQGRYRIGVLLGELFGAELLTLPHWQSVSAIVPIPLHPKKYKKRGYNQSDAIAEGMSKKMHIPYLPNAIIRNTNTQTQTKKSKEERWKNVEQIFDIQYPELLENQHVLLLDDVITTGSTMEACAEIMLKIPGLTISIAGLACADRF